jgi:hypothetical protein
MDPSADIINTMGRLYDISSLASLGYGDTTFASIYQAAASSTFIPNVLDLLKIVSFIACIFLTIVIVTIMGKMRILNSAPKAGQEAIVIEEVTNAPEPSSVPAPAPGGWLAARWGEITRHMESAKEAEWRFAIIEADKMVEEVLKRAGYPGNSLGERLMNMEPGQLETLDGLWYAHKIRNRIAHDMSYFLRYTEAKQVIGFFEATLREFRAV